MGNRVGVLAKIFANPDVPALDDYYEPFDYDYQHLHTAKQGKHQPVARPRSLITGRRMNKIESGPNWERSSAGNSKNARRTRISTTCRRRCTASSKTPS